MKKLLVILMALLLCLGVFVACGDDNTPDDSQTPVTYDVNAAATYIFNMYKTKTTMNGDLEVTSKVVISDVTYTVEWTATEGATITKKNDNVYVVDVNEKTPEEYKFTLTATIKAGDGTSATKSFEMTVPAYNVISFEEYMAAKEGDTVTVQGIVAAINSKAMNNKYNHLFLVDEEGKGGYYCYKLLKDPVADSKVEVGMTVTVTGKIAPYSGMQEIKEGAVQIVDSNKKTVPVVDITEKFAAGESMKNFVSVPVTIKGVEIKNQDLSTETSQYLYFMLNGRSAYLRTYITDFPLTLPLTKDGSNVVSADKATIDAAHAAHFGWRADVTGILVLYSSEPYLIPMSVDCFNYIEKIEKTPEQKVDDVIATIKLPTVVNKDGELALPTTNTAYPEVTIAWASNNAAAVIGTGKVTFTIPATATEITLTATITCGDTVKTQEYKITLTKMLDPNSVATIPEANAMGAAQAHNTYTTGKYFVTGVIDEIANTQYGNLYIKDADGNKFYVYGLYDATGVTGFSNMTTKPAVGDTITVYGALGQFGGNAQMKNGWLVSTLPAADATLPIPGANAIGLAQGHNKYTPNKYYVTGVIDEIANAQYGNLYIKDAAGNKFYVYGLYSADGTTGFSNMATKPAVGDTITVYGILGQYNGNAQMKNGWLAEEPAGGDGDEGGEVTPPPAGGDTTGTEIAVGTNYYLAGVNAHGTIYAKNSITSGRLNAATTATNAAVWQVEAGATAGEYYIFTMVGNTKTYLGANSDADDKKTQQFLLSAEKTDDCIWVVDATAKSIVSKNFTGRCIGTQNNSTYDNFSTYATSNFGTDGSIYVYAWFAAVEA